MSIVSGTVTKLKPDLLKFSTTTKHNKSNQHRKHSVSNNKPTKPCFRCASTDHTAYECKYKSYTCAYCKKVGHLQSNCFVKKKKKENPKKQNNVNLSDDNDKVAYTLYNVSSRSAPYKTNIIIDGKHQWRLIPVLQ